MNKQKRLKKGISLIVLVITIIVMIILAATIIISLNNAGVINSANKAVDDTNLKQVQTQAQLKWSDWYTRKSTTPVQKYIEEKLGADIIAKYTILANNNGVTVYEPVWNATKQVNGPVLKDGMTAVKFDSTNNTWVNVTNEELASGSWYDYTETNKNWANATTADGSYWVWVPRFEYKIAETPGSVAIDAIDKLVSINFIQTGTTTATTGYTIHPAFVNESATGFVNGGWDSELDGIWVAKYEMSAEKKTDGVYTHLDTSNNTAGDANNGNIATSDTIRMVSKPGVTSWRNINIANMYNNVLAYATQLGLTTYNSHLMKNSEWGAVAYLSRSKFGTTYGRGTNTDDVNTNTSYTTGGSATEATIYTTNIKQSSTGTVYGIYDLSGCVCEYTAAFNAAYSGTYFTGDEYKPVSGSHFASENGTSTKYATAYYNNSGTNYPTKAIAKTGDATYEVCSSTAQRTWNNDYVYFVSSGTPFFRRGGFCNSGSNAGMFYAVFDTGYANEYYGFRAVLSAL